MLHFPCEKILSFLQQKLSLDPTMLNDTHDYNII